MLFQDSKVLVVDDDALMRRFIRLTLTKLPVKEIAEATDGAHGLQAVEAFVPDIILSDVHMAPMGGLEFVRQLRAVTDKRLCRIPVIMLSADDKQETFHDAVPLGIFGHLSKPPQLEQLKEMMSRALKFRQQ
jgi:CheY-like chemotaxis protein